MPTISCTRGGDRPAKCRSCGALIVWATTKTGRRMPVDAEPSPDGTIGLGETERGLQAYFPSEFSNWPGPLHKSHFATCPNAQQHRR